MSILKKIEKELDDTVKLLMTPVDILDKFESSLNSSLFGKKPAVVAPKAAPAARVVPKIGVASLIYFRDKGGYKFITVERVSPRWNGALQTGWAGHVDATELGPLNPKLIQKLTDDIDKLPIPNDLKITSENPTLLQALQREMYEETQGALRISDIKHIAPVGYLPSDFPDSGGLRAVGYMMEVTPEAAKRILSRGSLSPELKNAKVESPTQITKELSKFQPHYVHLLKPLIKERWYERLSSPTPLAKISTKLDKLLKL